MISTIRAQGVRMGAEAVTGSGNAPVVDGLPAGRVIGRGRSAFVRLVRRPDGVAVEKVFIGDRISNLVHAVLTGAPLPYRWCEDAVAAAAERRGILSFLLPLWFGDEVGIAEALGWRWDGEARAFALIAEHIDGEPVRLRHPYQPRADAEERLRQVVMPTLQGRLRQSGFFGIVWQAGLGNPKALDNFLHHPESGNFTWIDQESGVPAVFATSISAWRRFYLPMTWRFGRAMMDDVDCGRLRAYLAEQQAALAALHGRDGVAALSAHVDRLDEHQARWLGLGRRARRHAAAAQIGARPKRRGAGVGRAVGAVQRAGRSVLPRLDPRRHWQAARAFATSQSYRTGLGVAYVRSRIAHWRDRGQLSARDAERLAADLRREAEAGRYLTDFGAHLGMKASFFAAEIAVLGVLSLFGVPLYLLGLVFVLDGPIYRTAYSGYRSVQNLFAGRPVLWTALAVGVIPFFGTLAFPAQMLWSASGRRDPVASFIVYDSFSRLAAAVPLVGGENTALEHRLNRLAHRIAAA